MHTLELEHKTLSISRSTLSLRDLFVLQIKPMSHAFLLYFLAVQCSNIQIFLFLFYEFNYLHQILTNIFTWIRPVIQTDPQLSPSAFVAQ